MRQVIKHRDIRLLNMIKRTDPVIPLVAKVVNSDKFPRLLRNFNFR